MTLHFFDQPTTDSFIALCRQMKITCKLHKTDSDPRFHVTAKRLVEAWSAESTEQK